MGVRGALLGIVVVFGLAGLVRADDPAPRKSWQELLADYQKIHDEHGEVSSEIVDVERALQDAEAKLGPLRAIEAQLMSTCAPNDSRVADAAKAVMQRVYELRVPENTVRHSQLVERRLALCEAALAAGNRALRAIYEYTDRMGIADVGTRSEQVEAARMKSLRLAEQLDRLENEGTPLPLPFRRLGPDPTDPRRIGHLITLYEDEAATVAQVVSSLDLRADLKRAQREHLVTLLDRGAKLDSEERIKRLDARLDEIETARSGAAKKLDDLNREIARLGALKAQLEKNLSRDGQK